MTTLRETLRKQLQRTPRLLALLRSVKRGIESARTVSTDARRGRIEVMDPLPTFSVGGSGRVSVQVTNASPRAWPARAVALSYHWRRADGSVWGRDGGRTRIMGPLAPGGAVTLECVVISPNTPGAYSLELELVTGLDGWFAAAGSTRREIAVGGMQPDAFAEIDYEKIYAAADLKKDYWGVAGPASAEEFRQLGRGKAEMLKALGLRPDSKILDVGCGTGSLAEPLAEYLAADGLYFGTDLSEVAVQFCRAKFPQANFRFEKNGMTTLPIEGERFDFIVFFSVFTHTYPAETGALLAEAARVLRDTGIIVADVFESDIEGESLGTRAMIVLPRGRMLDLARAQGLEARTISEFAWDPTGPRRIDRVMRRFARRGSAVSG
jgi:SAM-dependent methyltransferase